MTTPQAITGQTARTVPVACTLTSADLAAQARRWEQLMDLALAERAETADGVRLSFRAEPGAEEELRSLVAVERECCAWASWKVDKSDGAIVLDVRSTAEGIPALHGMFWPDQAAR